MWKWMAIEVSLLFVVVVVVAVPDFAYEGFVVQTRLLRMMLLRPD
jgi:hypothetical protein